MALWRFALLLWRGPVPSGVVERLKVVRGRRGVSSALEDPYGGGVGTAIGLLQNLVGHSLIDRDRFETATASPGERLRGFGEPQP